MKPEIREHYTDLINHKLQIEYETNECQCDDCSTGITYDGHCGVYSGQEIIHMKKIEPHGSVRGHWIWCFFSDINRSKKA